MPNLSGKGEVMGRWLCPQGRGANRWLENGADGEAIPCSAVTNPNLLVDKNESNGCLAKSLVIGLHSMINCTCSTEEGCLMAEEHEIEDLKEAERRALNKRLENIAWALFLIMLGGLLLIPDERVPSGLWPIGVGLLFLGLNAARYLNGLRMSGFTIFLGIVALLSGIGDMSGIDLPLLPILLILLGVYFLLRPVLERNKI
jgi:hypothetical protein